MKKIFSLLLMLICQYSFGELIKKSLIEKTEVSLSNGQLHFTTPIQTDHVYSDQIIGKRTWEQILHRQMPCPDITIPLKNYLVAYKASGYELYYKTVTDTFIYNKTYIGLIGERVQLYKKIKCITEKNNKMSMKLIIVPGHQDGNSTLSLGVLFVILWILYTAYILFFRSSKGDDDKKVNWLFKIPLVSLIAACILYLLKILYFYDRNITKDGLFGNTMIAFGVFFVAIFILSFLCIVDREKDEEDILGEKFCLILFLAGEFILLRYFTGSIQIAGRAAFFMGIFIVVILIKRFFVWINEKLIKKAFKKLSENSVV